MDWDLCVICQSFKTGEPLQCPALSKRKDVGASYSSFATNLEEFRKINAVPLNINTEVLNQVQGVEQTLNDKKAKWHKTCRNCFSNEKLDRAKKRKILESQNKVSSEMSLESVSAPEISCSPVKARRHASGDMVATEAKYHLKCLVNLYNQARKVSLNSTENTASSSFAPIDTEELAFAELIAFIDESLQVEEPTDLILSSFTSQSSVT